MAKEPYYDRAWMARQLAEKCCPDEIPEDLRPTWIMGWDHHQGDVEKFWESVVEWQFFKARQEGTFVGDRYIGKDKSELKGQNAAARRERL